MYQIQKLLRMVNKGVSSRQEEVNNAWKIVNNLPDSNWYQHSKDLMKDHIIYGDVGMYDMFLHKQDRAYSIPQLYQFLANQKLHLVEFTNPYTRITGNLKPETHIKDSHLLETILKMDKITQQAICEIITGSICKHSFYTSKEKDTIADFNDLDNVPYFYTMHNIPSQVADYLDKNHLIGSYVDFSWTTPLGIGDINVKIPVSKYTKYLFKGMIGSTKSFNPNIA